MHTRFLYDNSMDMYIDTVPNRGSPPTILIRESYREGGKVRKRTIANITKLPEDAIEQIRAVLRGSSVSGAPGGKLRGAFEISRAVAHGDACAVLAALRACGIDKAIDPRRSPARDLAVALVAQRVLRPGSKLAAARGFRPESASSTLAAQLKLPKDVCANRLYEAMDWLLGRQPRIEKALAEKYLKEGKPVLYDLTSTWSYSRNCPLARHGYSRDRKRGLQPSLFDQQDMAEIECEEKYPGERLVVCRNPLLAEERTRKRRELIAAAAAELEAVRRAVRRDFRPLRCAEKIWMRADKILGNCKMRKHFELKIGEGSFSWKRKKEAIAAEAALDGFYVIRTSVPEKDMSAAQAVLAYKSLGKVERAFRTMKASDLEVRPIRHWLDRRVRAHLLICMLAYHVEMHMRKALAPMLFHDEDGSTRESPVAKAERSRSARRKAATKRTRSGLEVHDFRGLLKHLGDLTMNRVKPKGSKEREFDIPSSPTPTQAEALRLLNAKIASG